MCSRGEPLKTRGLLGMRGDVVAARMVGIWQEGKESLPDGAVREGDEVREARTAAMTSRERCAVCELSRWCAMKKKNKQKKRKPRHFE